uniref:Uncharacterized protein n=1 Tax=Homalodisca liturata TaxID=320908 RepID=A0A1B6J066_9HEMI
MEERSQVPCILIEDDDDIILVEDENEKPSSSTYSGGMPRPKKTDYELEMDLLQTLLDTGERVPIKYKLFCDMAKKLRPATETKIILAAWKRIVGQQSKKTLTKGTLFNWNWPSLEDTDSQDSDSIISGGTYYSGSITEDTDSQDTFSPKTIDTDSMSDTENTTAKEENIECGNADHLEIIHISDSEEKALHELNSNSSVESQAGSKKKVVQLNQNEKTNKRKRKSGASDGKRKRKSDASDSKKKRKIDAYDGDLCEHTKLYLSTNEYKNFLYEQKKLIYAEKKKLAHKQMAKLHDRMVDLFIPKYFNRNHILNLIPFKN